MEKNKTASGHDFSHQVGTFLAKGSSSKPTSTEQTAVAEISERNKRNRLRKFQKRASGADNNIRGIV